MRIGILGTGDVGRTLGSAFIELGYDVKLGGREAHNPAASEWAAQCGSRASFGTFEQVAKFGDLLVLATLGVANEAVLQAAGLANFDEKLVIDVTNPLDFSGGLPVLTRGHLDSGGEQVQRLVPRAKVVKALNSVGHTMMFRPQVTGGPPDMFMCGDDPVAKARVSELLEMMGWGAVDAGPISSSRYIEPMCMLWLQVAFATGSGSHAFKLLR